MGQETLIFLVARRWGAAAGGGVVVGGGVSFLIIFAIISLSFTFTFGPSRRCEIKIYLYTRSRLHRHCLISLMRQIRATKYNRIENKVKWGVLTKSCKFCIWAFVRCHAVRGFIWRWWPTSVDLNRSYFLLMIVFSTQKRDVSLPEIK